MIEPVINNQFVGFLGIKDLFQHPYIFLRINLNIFGTVSSEIRSKNLVFPMTSDYILIAIPKIYTNFAIYNGGYAIKFSENVYQHN